MLKEPQLNKLNISPKDETVNLTGPLNIQDDEGRILLGRVSPSSFQYVGDQLIIYDILVTDLNDIEGHPVELTDEIKQRFLDELQRRGASTTHAEDQYPKTTEIPTYNEQLDQWMKHMDKTDKTPDKPLNLKASPQIFNKIINNLPPDDTDDSSKDR